MTKQFDIHLAKIRTLCERYRVAELALFGSARRADFSSDSDVDLLVTFQPNAAPGFLALAGLQRELAELLQRHVDLVPKDGLKALIRDDVLASAEVLYAA